ncbi:hypothetical protein FALBO_17086, partial [Fusarium albosuccineum]
KNKGPGWNFYTHQPQNRERPAWDFSIFAPDHHRIPTSQSLMIYRTISQGLKKAPPRRPGLPFSLFFFCPDDVCADGPALNVFAAPSEKEPLEIIPGYFEGPPIQWEVKAFRDGPELHLNGTIEEVRAELLSLSPNYDADFADQGPDDDEDRVTLEKRTDFSNANTNCDFPGNFASAPRIDQGIKYLRGVKGKPRMPAGPGACGRVSCGYNAGIWWCNDDKKSKTLNSFGSITDGAQRVRDKCSHRFSNPGGTGDIMRVKGQAFHSTHWNVIVREIKC